MPPSEKKPKVLDCKSSDNVYLHKDFHGCLCYAIEYLDKTYGPETTRRFLMQAAKAVYRPLIEQLAEEGLSALRRHWEEIFRLEGGLFECAYDGEVLVLKVEKCPAVAHLIERGQLFTDRFCETTAVVNETICREAGYRSECEYEPGRGRCVQRFWKAGK